MLGQILNHSPNPENRFFHTFLSPGFPKSGYPACGFEPIDFSDYRC